MEIVREFILVKGIVQGVGFRPFVYKLATKLNLKGYVKNSQIGVEIELEGREKELESFEKLFFEDLPPLARVDKFSKKRLTPLCHYERFEIVESSRDGQKVALIPPDIKVCSECLRDISTFNSRFHKYFATNCTNCGPRYSIIQTVPYDRKNTSMKKFSMCSECKDDYENPLSRRYHAQPISCKACGPVIRLKIENEELKMQNGKSRVGDDIFKEVAKLIKRGKIGAIKGVGGFHIVCDATDDSVVKRLRKLKHRPTKPFALMCKDIEQIKSFAKVTKKEEELLLSKEAPIVLLEWKIENAKLRISEQIAPVNFPFSTLHFPLHKIGCMLPYTPLHFLLFEHLDTPIVATSANLSGEPIITDVKELEEKLSFLEFVVDFNRDIVNAIDDSVVQVVDGDIQILRLARGYAPKVLKLPKKIDKNILAVGANQKSTISITFEDNLILSPYIADLDSIKSFSYFEKTIETFKRFYDFFPDVVVCDKHPNYESTKWAKKWKVKNEEYKIKEVQHHKAHLASVKAEFGLSGDEYVGFIFDGTGLGNDNTLWGGEVFVDGKRKYYFKPIKLIGGEKAIKEPYRVALSLLFEKYSLKEVLEFNLPYKNIPLLYQTWKKELNTPKSSSVGRLFDGVASLARLCDFHSYEGEAGLLSEWKIENGEWRIEEGFSYKIVDGVIEIEWDFFDEFLVQKFYLTLVSILVDIAKKEQKTVLLSGGVFQNKTLLEMIIKEFKKENITYYYNKTIPINDSGVSVGQVWEGFIEFLL
jgi:hydrogenase maturation protein HypF